METFEGIGHMHIYLPVNIYIYIYIHKYVCIYIYIYIYIFYMYVIWAADLDCRFGLQMWAADLNCRFGLVVNMQTQHNTICLTSYLCVFEVRVAWLQQK